MPWGRPRQVAEGGSVPTFKLPARVATTGNIADLAAGAPLVVDGVNLNDGDRVLVWAQAAAEENGVYLVAVAGTGADGQWIRAADFDSAVEAEQCTGVYVQEGATNGDYLFVLLTDPPITIGVTPLTFAKYPVAAAGDPLFDFTFATASPAIVSVLAAADLIEWAKVVITVPFDDPASVIQLGITGTPGAIFAPGDVDPTVADVTVSEEVIRPGVGTNLELAIAPAASIQGSGYVLARIRR